MTNLHTTSDVSRFIGALEFGTDLRDGDGALETAGTAAALNAPTMSFSPICSPVRHIDDGALELIGGYITAGPTGNCRFTNPLACPHIDDDVLETAAATAAPTHTFNPVLGSCV